MLLSIARPAIALTATDDPVIEAMVNLTPDYSAGGRLHDIYVNKLCSALPGNYSQLFGSGPSFRSVFFPNWQPDPLLSVAGNTGLDDGWWRAFSVAVLCQAIAEMGSNIRGQMLTDKINGDIASFNGTLRGRSARAYAAVLALAYDPLISLLRQVNPATAKQQFHDALLSNVLNRQLWYQAGQWTSPDWEMFNQYAKYIALGASDEEVYDLIQELKNAGLPIPPQVDGGAWWTYAEELRNKPNVDVNDVRGECAGPIGETTYIPNPRGMPAQLPNGNCYEFTASTQPGNAYRQPPGGCCFTGDTEVLNELGVPVPLRQIRPKDTVLTRDGTAKVAFVPRPLRAARPLYRLSDGGPVFTATHPFLNGAAPDPRMSVPALLALDPQRLAEAVPTLSESGIGTLDSRSTLLARAPGSGLAPIPASVVGIEEVTDGGDDRCLFDLNLVTSSGVRQEFWAGQGDKFYLVSPEFPFLDDAGAAATTVVAVMEGLLAADRQDKAGWPPGIVDTVDRFGAGVFYGALMEALASTPSFGPPVPPEPLYDRIAQLYGSLDAATDETAAVVASLFDGLMSAVGQWLTSIVAVGWRTSVGLGGDVLAVTVFDVALTPTNPIPADTSIRLDLTATGRTQSARVPMWDRRGRANTRFHHYFDQLVHLDMAGDDAPAELSFAATIDGAPIPSLLATVLPVVGDGVHRLHSAVLRDAADVVVGTIRYDMRRLGRDAASQELAQSGLWTRASADAYANALGTVMADLILMRLREWAPKST